MESVWAIGPSATATMATRDLGVVWWHRLPGQGLSPDQEDTAQFTPPLPRVDLSLSCVSDLPYGWEQETDENGQVYFVE